MSNFVEAMPPRQPSRVLGLIGFICAVLAVLGIFLFIVALNTNLKWLSLLVFAAIPGLLFAILARHRDGQGGANSTRLTAIGFVANWVILACAAMLAIPALIGFLLQ